MLTFTSLGGATVRMQTRKQALTVLAENGIKPAEGELVLRSTPQEQPEDRIISWPGEYDMCGVSIQGIGQKEGAAVSYTIDAAGMRCAFLHSPLMEWTGEQIEQLGDVDILFIPSDSPKIMQKLIDEIDPRILVVLNTGGVEKYAEALKVCGATGKEPVKLLEVKAGSLPQEGREVVVLEA